MSDVSPEKMCELVRDSFVGATVVYQSGSCAYFARLMVQVFDGAYYSSKDHMVARIGEKFYDITGEVEGDFSPATEKDFKKMKRRFSLASQQDLDMLATARKRREEATP
jgi:hypothetical protein